MGRTWGNENNALVAVWRREGAAAWAALASRLREAIDAWDEDHGWSAALDDRSKTATAPPSSLLALFDHFEAEQKWRLFPPYASFFELFSDILVTVLEEVELCRRFFTRDEEQKINVYAEPINIAEGLALEPIKVREFLRGLEKELGRQARVIFQAKYLLGYTYQEIADFLGVGAGSVRYQLRAATTFFIDSHGQYF